MVNIYTESEFKTILSCPKLYALGGDINNYTQSQSFLISILDMFTLALVKEEFEDIDVLIDSCVRRAYNKHYSKQDIDESTIVRLKKYGYSFINKYVQIFNNNEYQILLTKNAFFLDYEDTRIRLQTNSVYKQANRKGFLHIVCFVPYIDQHLLANDFFINLKAYFYKKYATKARYASRHSEITIHLVSAPSFNKYRSKTTDFAFYHEAIQIKELPQKDITSYIEQVNASVEFAQPIPLCQNKSCSKRKECFNV